MNEKFPALKNKQRATARIFTFLTLVTLVLMILPFTDGNPLSKAWALAFISIFLTISFAITALIFRNRAKKMDKLKSGEKLLVHLKLDDEMLHNYASTLKAESKEKNKAIMWVVGILFLIFTIPFLFFLESDERGGFLIIIGSIVFAVFMASRFFPGYYYRKNLKGDRQILIGEKYAYFNGYFHNWDYPLSGLTKIKAIKTPFYGLHLAYFYTDRTWRHVQEIKLPLPIEFDPKPLIERMRMANKLKDKRK
ncbi:hypothetical protein [Draconibacterium sp.]|uniref:hypothetical protein n=1 Tax=Draconibacterium sp. TaxID=1965318 RepID=UPI0035614949